MFSRTQAYSEDKTGLQKKPPKLTVGEFDEFPSEQTNPKWLAHQARLSVSSLRPHNTIQLQRIIGNQALGNLLLGKTQPQKAVINSPTIQRDLSADEEKDKLRVLKDYVQFTPPQHFSDEWGRPPNNKVSYRLALLDKIRRTTNVAYSLKARKDMRPDKQDDDWGDNSFNDKTLANAIDALYNDGLKLKDTSRRIGRTDAEFDKHDCVWAAVTYALGFPDSLDVERRLAAWFSSQEGEVEDSILYRIMEELGWSFQGQGDFSRMFPQPPGIGTAHIANVKGYYDGRYIISEDKNAGGTQGHVLAVDVKDVVDPSELGFRRQITLTDRQYRRQNQVDRQNQPQFAVYVWKVQGDNSVLINGIRGG